MANRPNKKASDEDLLRHNRLGRSLQWIGEALGLHPTSVSSRLRSLGVAPVDTRRSFMDDILAGMSPEQMAWLDRQLSTELPIKSYVRHLIRQAYIDSKETR